MYVFKYRVILVTSHYDINQPSTYVLKCKYTLENKNEFLHHCQLSKNEA